MSKSLSFGSIVNAALLIYLFIRTGYRGFIAGLFIIAATAISVGYDVAKSCISYYEEEKNHEKDVQ